MRQLMVILVVLAWALSILWCVADAKTRNRSGCLVGLLAALFWPWSLLMWLVCRPALPAEEAPGSDHLGDT